MGQFLRSLRRMFRLRSPAAFLVILTGLGLTIFFGFRTIQSFRRIPEFPPRPPHPAQTDIESIRPWMNLKFIAKVYGIHPRYLHHYLEVPLSAPYKDQSLAELNQALNLGSSANGGPLLLEQVKLAIQEYQAHPDGMEIQHISPSMSIQFICAVKEIPSATVFDALGIPKTGNAFKSIEEISREQNFKGGWEALALEIEQIIEGVDGY